jgi:hypothetical protein
VTVIDYQIVVERVDAKQPDSNAHSKMYVSGDIVEIQTMDRLPQNLSRYRRLDGSNMVDTSTGEVLPCRIPEKRLDSKKNLKASMTTLKRLINCNFTGSRSELHLTLTYGHLMTDTQRLYRDFRLFWLRLKYRYPSLDYLSIAEPQRSGSWHFHVLIKDALNNYLCIPNDVISSLWGHGFTKTIRIPKTTNFGIYFTSRLINVDLLEGGTDSNDSKRIVKGGRLKHYPARFRFYRASKGIKRPVVLRMRYGKAMELIGNSSPLYEATKNIVRIDPDGTKQIVNSITYQEHNIKRK